MTLELPVIQDAPAKTCCRSGDCCRDVMMHQSPRQLRDNFESWSMAPALPSGVPYDAILIWNGLKGTCRGKIVSKGGDGAPDNRYMFGPCANLGEEIVDGKVLAKCNIHETRPYLCRGYPYYEDTRDKVTGYVPPLDHPNPGYIKGCGYNQDPENGVAVGERDEFLWPLDEDEL